MPQFFFHLRTPDGLDPDEDGLTFADLDTAYLEAYASIPDMAAELAGKGLSPMPYGFVITDAAGQTLLEIPFAERLYDPRQSSHRCKLNSTKRLREIHDAIVAREIAQHSREIIARSRKA
ncbi:DUF6894 family protein [Methylobacterium sp. SI9]|uniref:DUF6894 family protein n=1 Tax=Methylobacterium guangdongense TaxID=3138811 RepID=UPI00313C4D58